MNITPVEKDEISKIDLDRCKKYLEENGWTQTGFCWRKDRSTTSTFSKSWEVGLPYDNKKDDYEDVMVELVLGIQKAEQKSISTIVSEIEKYQSQTTNEEQTK